MRCVQNDTKYESNYFTSQTLVSKDTILSNSQQVLVYKVLPFGFRMNWLPGGSIGRI
jgi:hypothetical protein